MGTYRSQSLDTTEAIDRLMFDAYRRMSPLEKLRRVADLNRMSKQLAVAGLRQRFPAADEDELMARWAAHFLTRKDLMAIFGWDPEEVE